MADNATIQSILDYFGSNSSIYRKIVLGQATDAEISYAFTQIPQMKIDVSASGSTMGYSYADPVYIVPSQTDNIVSSVTSNSGGSGYGGGISTNYPISIEHDPDTGQAYINAGKNGLGDAIKAVADRVSLGITGVNIGCKLGKAIDETLYNLAPDWWEEHYPTINPDTWPSLVGENEAGQKFFRTLFNIDDNGNVTGYVDEKVLAQTYQMLRDMGLWNDEDKITAPTIEPGTGTFTNDGITYADVVIDAQGTTIQGVVATNTNENEYAVFWTGGIAEKPYLISTGPYALNRYGLVSPNIVFNNTLNVGKKLSERLTLRNFTIGGGPGNNLRVIANDGGSWHALRIVIDGVLQPAGITGISDIDGATQYPPTNITGTTLDDVLTQLKQQYPDLFTDAITENVVQSDGTVTPRTYVPVPWQITDPTNKTQTAPITQTNPTTQTQINPEVAPQVITQTQPTSLDDTTTPPPDTPDTGTGNSDPVILPTGQASSLWAIYNPTQAELNSFGGWLWSSNFVEQLKKLFNDPMQAIIGVHKVFATPNTGGTRTIVCGYLDSGVTSKIVSSQYTNVNCGTVDLREYFGNVFDYSPYTSVKIYLPFIGIVPLDVSYIMRSSISVKYSVDVLTGACLANVEVNRDGGGGVIFSYGGSAIVSYPISSGSYVGVVSGALSVIAGVAGTIATGGGALPVLAGVASGIQKSHTDIQHSGQFSGSAGAMGSKKPYLIISRPQTRMANNVKEYSGIPSNATLRIGDCTGFTQVKEVHLKISNAYDSEIMEIEQLLKSGVII